MYRKHLVMTLVRQNTESTGSVGKMSMVQILKSIQIYCRN